MQFTCFGAVFKMVGWFSLIFELLEEVPVEDFLQEQLLRRADDEAILLLAAAWPSRKEHVRTKNFYENTVPNNIPGDF